MKRVLMCILLLRMSDAIESAGGEVPQPEVINDLQEVPVEDTPIAPAETFLEKVEDKLEEIGEEIKEVAEEVVEAIEGKDSEDELDAPAE